MGQTGTREKYKLGTFVRSRLWLRLTVAFALIILIGILVTVLLVRSGAATVLPVQVFIWENASERGFHERTAAAILVLLVFMIVMNLAAILVRRRFERRW